MANNRRQPRYQTGIRDPNTPENAETVAGGEAISMASKKTKPDLAAGLITTLCDNSRVIFSVTP